VKRMLILLGVVFPFVFGITPASAQTTLPPIEHLVVIVEQNSTFDHTFGNLPSYPPSDGIGATARPRPAQRGAQGLRMIPFSQLGPGDFDVRHGEEILSNGPIAAQTAYDGGKRDGFYNAQQDVEKNADLSFSILDQDTPSPWRRLAGQSVVFDRYFSSALGGSLPNTLNLVAGDAGHFTDSSRQSLQRLWKSDMYTIFDAAAGQGVSWRYYVGGLNHIHERKIANGDYARSPDSAPSQLYWAPILSMGKFWNDPTLLGNIRTQNDFFHDAAAGTLPNITYLLPQPTSHEPLILSPDLRVLSIVNALRTSPDWEHTAVLVVWDDWGGYYDHVSPPVMGGQQVGFRVPMMLLSPYAMPGVSSQDLDHSSIPRLAASLFGLSGFTAGRSDIPANVWSGTPVTGDRIVALSHPEHYRAAGMQHAPSVFILYLLTIVMITGVLFVVGVTLRIKPDQGGNVP
jgi:phospholipase C